MFAGIVNARPEAKDRYEPPVDMEKLPFDPLEFIDFELPYEKMDPDLGQ